MLCIKFKDNIQGYTTVIDYTLKVFVVSVSFKPPMHLTKKCMVTFLHLSTLLIEMSHPPLGVKSVA